MRLYKILMFCCVLLMATIAVGAQPGRKPRPVKKAKPTPEVIIMAYENYGDTERLTQPIKSAVALSQELVANEYLVLCHS